MRAILPWLVCLVITACGGGGSGSSGGSASTDAAAYGAQPSSCEVADQRVWLKAYMADQYFWSASLGAANASAATMDGYFRALLYSPTDRFSYSQSTEDFLQFFSEGTRTGYGYSLVWADAAKTTIQVSAVEPLSPVAKAGLARGDTILSIDGFGPAQIGAGALASVTTAGVARSFSVRSAAGTGRSFTAFSVNYRLTPVSSVKILTAANGAQVAYLAYQEFITSSAPALAAAINLFRAGRVTELILDLRYNGGGSVTTARNLASLIGGASLAGNTFAALRFNAANSASNVIYPFTSDATTLATAPLDGLNRLFVITSASTASASELLINALRPFRNVVSIGTATYGKPYGFQPRAACGITYSAVNFDAVNAQGVGGYTSGLAPTCVMSDDLAHELGDPAERRIAAALSYMQTGACPAFANLPLVSANAAVRPGQDTVNAPTQPAPADAPPVAAEHPSHGMWVVK